MPTLERLVHLKELQLLFRSFSGRIMVCAGSGFPQLHKLKLSELDGLEEWIVEDGSMPQLHTLEIRRCPKLKKLPNGFPQLQNLELNELEMGRVDSRGWLHATSSYSKNLELSKVKAAA